MQILQVRSSMMQCCLTEDGVGEVGGRQSPKVSVQLRKLMPHLAASDTCRDPSTPATLLQCADPLTRPRPDPRLPSFQMVQMGSAHRAQGLVVPVELFRIQTTFKLLLCCTGWAMCKRTALALRCLKHQPSACLVRLCGCQLRVMMKCAA